jgi:hypothetical protein
MGAEALRLDWEQFISDCAHAYDQGISEHQFGGALVGVSVRWQGTICELHVRDGELVPGMKLDMPWCEVPLRDGFHFIGADLFLELESVDTISAARQLQKGDRVHFTGTFRDQGIFANVRFTPDEQQRKVFLSLGLRAGSIL